MAGTWILAVAVVCGVDYGWQPHEDGGLEYIIQIEPWSLEALHQGSPIVSQIPPELRGIQQFRIQVGRQPLPQDGGTFDSPELSLAAPTDRDAIPGPFPDTGSVSGPISIQTHVLPAEAVTEVTQNDVLDQSRSVLERTPDDDSTEVNAPLQSLESGTALPGSDLSQMALPTEITPSDPYPLETASQFNSQPERLRREQASGSRYTELEQSPPGEGAESPPSQATLESRYSSPPETSQQPETGSDQQPAEEREDWDRTTAPFQPTIQHLDSAVTQAELAPRYEDPEPQGTGVARTGALPAESMETGVVVREMPGPGEDFGRHQVEGGEETDQSLAHQEQERSSTRSWSAGFLLLGLFASLATNAYMGWISYSAVHRYRELVDDLPAVA